MNALVVPTNSTDRLVAFLTAWAPWPWDRIVVVQDAPGVELCIPDRLAEAAAERLEAFSWEEIDEILPEPSIISRRDSAIRSFGFWRAWTQGAEIIFTLDDDCFPAGDDLVELHRSNLYHTPAWTSSVPGMRVRGLPYRHTSSLANVYVSMGLWRGSPDLDAIATLTDQPTDALAGARTRVMPSHQYFPLSGMNLAFRREVACLMYFAPMGAGQPFSRFDDIWCGLVVQRVFRHLGYSIVCGRPWINHRRASDPFVNLVKEAPGIGANENLWQTIDAIPLSGTSPKDCMQEVAAELAAQSDEYLADWGRRIASWCDLFGRVDDDVEVQPIAET